VFAVRAQAFHLGAAWARPDPGLSPWAQILTALQAAALRAQEKGRPGGTPLIGFSPLSIRGEGGGGEVLSFADSSRLLAGFLEQPARQIRRYEKAGSSQAVQLVAQAFDLAAQARREE
jgi:hypothetical protein